VIISQTVRNKTIVDRYERATTTPNRHITVTVSVTVRVDWNLTACRRLVCRRCSSLRER